MTTVHLFWLFDCFMFQYYFMIINIKIHVHSLKFIFIVAWLMFIMFKYCSYHLIIMIYFVFKILIWCYNLISIILSLHVFWLDICLLVIVDNGLSSMHIFLLAYIYVISCSLFWFETVFKAIKSFFLIIS